MGHGPGTGGPVVAVVGRADDDLLGRRVAEEGGESREGELSGFRDVRDEVGVRTYELGLLYSVQGRYAEAEPLIERALAIVRARLGESHVLVAEMLLGLAELQRDSGRPGEAEASYRRALAILEAGVAPDHPLLVRVRESYDALLEIRGREADVEGS